jgi:FkbM family methyltransferase
MEISNFKRKGPLGPLSTHDQDIWVLDTTNHLKNGYFVEMGSLDGILQSNTYILEKFYNWTGILVEPDIKHHHNLQSNRPNSNIEFNCVWSKTGEIKKFYQSDVVTDGRSTVEEFSSLGLVDRKNWRTYNVTTISLFDLLVKHNAPTYIDYLSLDTEGSELEILTNFDFTKYKFGCITVEHNTRKWYRNEIRNLLTQKGYHFQKEFPWDDGYIDPRYLVQESIS